MRIGYVCKYVPVEALEAMGAHMERIDPDGSLVSFDAAESSFRETLTASC